MGLHYSNGKGSGQNGKDITISINTAGKCQQRFTQERGR
jgi:hypothetical protein